MTLDEFLKMQQNDCSIDCGDTVIDATICVESDIYSDPDFPFMTKFIELFRRKVEVTGLNPVVLNTGELIQRNMDKVLKFVNENWNGKWEDDGSGELEYQLITEFNYLMAGYKGETMNRKYYELLDSFDKEETK